MTCGEKQEMYYHRYLSLYSLVVVASSLDYIVSRNPRSPLESSTGWLGSYVATLTIIMLVADLPAISF